MCRQSTVDSITYILFSTPAIRPQPVFTRPSPAKCRPPLVPFLFRTKQARPAEWGTCYFLHSAPYSSAQGKFVHVQCIKRNKGIHFLQYPPFLPLDYLGDNKTSSGYLYKYFFKYFWQYLFLQSRPFPPPHSIRHLGDNQTGSCFLHPRHQSDPPFLIADPFPHFC